MPIYEYTCEQCNRLFETLVLKKDDPPPPCPKCGHHKVIKQISSVCFSGSGGTDSCGDGAAKSGFS